MLTPEPEPRRGRRLWRLALLPWVVAAVLAVVAMTASREPARGSEDRLAPASAPATGSLVPGGSGAGQPVPDPGDDGDMRAAAAVAVRTGLSGSTGAGDGVRYVDLALGESVSWTGQDTAVVTVVAVVLDGSGGRWQEARTARYAVPLQRRDGRAVALGPPWPLPTDDAAAPADAWEPVAGPELAEPVVAALTDAGYDAVGGVELSRDPALAGVLRARLEAVAPGEPAARVHELWLRDGPSPVVLGHEPGAPPPPPGREPAGEPGSTAAGAPAGGR